MGSKARTKYSPGASDEIKDSYLPPFGSLDGKYCPVLGVMLAPRAGTTTMVAGTSAPLDGFTVTPRVATSSRSTTSMEGTGAPAKTTSSSVSRLACPHSADCTYQLPCGIRSTEYLPGSRLANARVCWPGAPSRVA